MRRIASQVLTFVALSIAFGHTAVNAGSLAPAETALRADELLANELFKSADRPLAKDIDDVTFLRRVSLDLIGELPSPSDVTRFALDPAADKRARLVERLLSDPRYGRNWARYWRDVILSRRSDERALFTADSVVAYLSDSFNRNVGWDEIARGFITATGDVRENGQTALFMAQMGEVPETAAETSRIFLGVQVQCAQCHDHPTDRWKRAQFHELAAFFPRTAVRPVRDGMQLRSYEVVSVERGGRRPGGMGVQFGPREHYMPDLKDPASRGTLMQPVFFLTGQKLDAGASDTERRNTLADWMTATSNPWFAKAFVNRLWGELVGEGFYEPIDDIGPERTCSAPQTMELISSQFAGHDYDVKWLLAAIISTDAYQRESRARRNPEQTPFVASCTQRLRADQLYDAVTAALGIEGSDDRPTGGYGPLQMRANLRSPRFQFSQAFGFDPSEPRDEIAGSIPQALLLMNAPGINRPIDGRSRDTVLGTLLVDTKDDADVTLELYLRFLAREPSEAELAGALDYVRQTGNRTDAFEDLAWCLLNSTEFLHKK